MRVFLNPFLFGIFITCISGQKGAKRFGTSTLYVPHDALAWPRPDIWNRPYTWNRFPMFIRNHYHPVYPQRNPGSNHFHRKIQDSSWISRPSSFPRKPTIHIKQHNHNDHWPDKNFPIEMNIKILNNSYPEWNIPPKIHIRGQNKINTPYPSHELRPTVITGPPEHSLPTPPSTLPTSSSSPAIENPTPPSAIETFTTSTVTEKIDPNVVNTVSPEIDTSQKRTSAIPVPPSTEAQHINNNQPMDDTTTPVYLSKNAKKE
ncbi:hypothetical protein SSS_00108 [Sarcoptes scabiei]|uniref:Uncharacterized protein n=1 Tax=Sarcoptes scabiei TaxID=52283 RepID=A0A834R5A7_SARSC|nr:hypothetical protein SSS_00108 [Sarcoptes scabiei]